MKLPHLCVHTDGVAACQACSSRKAAEGSASTHWIGTYHTPTPVLVGIPWFGQLAYAVDLDLKDVGLLQDSASQLSGGFTHRRSTATCKFLRGISGRTRHQRICRHPAEVGRIDESDGTCLVGCIREALAEQVGYC